MNNIFLATIIFLLPLTLQADTLFLKNRKPFEGTVTKWEVGKIGFVMKDKPFSEVWEIAAQRIDKIVIGDSMTYLPFESYWLNQKDTIYSTVLLEALSKPTNQITAEDLKLFEHLKCYQVSEDIDMKSLPKAQPTGIKSIPSISASTKKDRAPYFLVSALSLLLAYDYFSDASELKDGANALPEGDAKDELNSKASGRTTRGIISLVIGGIAIIAGSVK